ncbi:MAG: GH1 family beta-glucosidase [Candidatus Eisenbacteria bacterium]
MNQPEFPPDFVWGVATSAQQIEGAAQVAGRGESIWDRFASKAGRIADGSDPRVTCDHYHRWREDVDALRWLGVGGYRFSIAWPRILPTGSGRVNALGLDFYDALTDRLLEHGITPYPTLYHWDLPQRLQEKGGWTSRATVDAFVHFTDAVTRRLGDRITTWVTHNEPWCVSHLGHEVGVHAPGKRDPLAALAAAHHVLLSHGRAVDVIRRNVPGARVGIVNIIVPVQAASDSPADRDAARHLDGSFNRWYLDPLYKARYPADAIADRMRAGHLRGPELPFVHPGDLELIATRTDFMGVNYYSRAVARARADGRPEGVRQVPVEELTDMGWEVYPEGLYEVLQRVHRDYAPASILITENGAAYPDEPSAGPAGPFADSKRVAYLRTHLAQAARARREGVPLHGYFAWSFMDNFEWAEGLSKHFGLYHVDFRTLRRTPRESAFYYRDVITRGALAEDAGAPHSRRTM